MFTTTQLIEAVRDGDTENMGTLLAANPAAVNTVLEENCTLLQFAAEIGHLDMCRFLLRAGADLNTPPGPNSPYSSALQAAASGGFFDIVKTLAISKDADVNGRGPGGGGKNALEAAAEGGFLDVVMFLVEEAGAEVDFPHVDGGTLGTTALRAAAGTGREDVVRYLVAKGAAINATSGYSQETALNSAVEEGNDEIVEILVGCGADLDIAPMFGVTAIETAAMHGRFSTVMILLQAKGNTPDLSAAALRAAAAAGEIDIAKLILGMGKINVNSASEYGHTALHVAVLKGRLDLVDLFLGEHASTEVRDAEDKTPLLLALESSDPNMDIIRSLLDKGARSKGVSAENIQALLQPAGLQFVCLREGPTGRNNIIMAVHDDDPDLPPDRYLDPNRNPELRHITMPPTRYLYSAYGIKNPAPIIGYQCGPGLLETKGDATWKWGWSSHRSYPFDWDTRSVHFGLPNLSAPNGKPAASSLFCYVRFTIYTPATSNHDSDNESLQPFEMENEDCEILWAMSQETLRNPTAISTLPSLMHKPSVRSLLSIPGGAIPEWRHDFNKQLPVLEKKYRTILRATQFRSTLNQFWIPEHGVEFFTSFLLDIQDRWELLFKAAKLHLVESRKALLISKGRDDTLIGIFLKDSQTWSNFAERSHLHVKRSKELLHDFQENNILFDEVKHLEDQQPEYLREGKPSTLAKRRKGAGANLEAIKKLSRKISKFEGFCNKEISKLQDMTKDLVELEFSLVSIYEARRDISMSMSMKRLSWITFIFLPMMFATSIFGMNVDVLSNNPPWFWFLVFLLPMCAAIVLVWLLFKYVPIERYFSEKVDEFLQLFKKPESAMQDEEVAGYYGSKRSDLQPNYFRRPTNASIIPLASR